VKTNLRAALLKDYRKIEITELDEPKIGPHDLLIKVMACGLCPNDYRIYAGLVTWRKPPTTLGHEPSGVVVRVGDEVKGFASGDKVAGESSIRCGYCRPCVEGRENLCLNRRAIGNGSLSEYTAANEVYVNKFERASFDEAAFSEPLSCVLNGMRNSKVRLGDRVAVIGAGQIGLMHMQVAKLRGATTFVVDIKAERLKLASRLGADHVIDSSSEDAGARIRELTGGEGADRVIVAIGNAAAIETGLASVGRMGSVNLFASTNPPTKVQVDPNLIHHSEVSLIGSYDKTRYDLRLATELIDEGRVDVKALISHRFDLNGTDEALRLLEKGAGVKILVEPNRGG